MCDSAWPQYQFKDKSEPLLKFNCGPQNYTDFIGTQCTSIKGLMAMVSIRWHLGCLKGQLGGAGL